MGRTTKILGFSVPPTLVREVETLARAERRTKSELFREMVRVYRRYHEQRERDEERWISNILQDAKTEQEQNPMSTEDMLKEDARMSRYGEKQTRKLGIKLANINRLIHEYRSGQKA